MDKALDNSTSATESITQAVLGVADTALNVVVPTMATAGAGSMLAASMSNMESGLAAAAFGGKLLVDNVAKPIVNSKKEKSINATSTATASQKDHPIFSVISKTRSDLQTFQKYFLNDGAKIDWLKLGND